MPELPQGANWVYEPKWDGFRCLALKDGKNVVLQGKSGKPLDRYFPEVVQAIASIKLERLALDGEIIIRIDGELDFDALQQRLHPAASRIAKLSKETPASFTVFDTLLDVKGQADRRLAIRRPASCARQDCRQVQGQEHHVNKPDRQPADGTKLA